MEYNRELQNKIKNDFFKGKAIILAGARQVGKTTLMDKILKSQKSTVLYLNADNPTDRSKLNEKDLEFLKNLVNGFDVVFIDEAQKVENIGQTLKLLVDYYKTSKQFIATGSSSINLLSSTQEALTGRKFVYELYGLSASEIIDTEDSITLERMLSDLLIYGSYPEIVASSTDKARLLSELASSYLYQDILELEEVRNPAAINKLLSAISLQLGSQVSISELANLVNLDNKTVERYIDLLEKNYVIFRLPPYYTNERKSLSKLNKIYFYDLGIRNALINNLNDLDLRRDTGALWENFVVVERLKWRKYKMVDATQYFWRTYDGAEVDLVERREGYLYGYEIKWGAKDVKMPISWSRIENSKFEVINRENYLGFITGQKK